MRVGELCQRLDVPYRHARYILEERILPPGVDINPGRGEHRQLDAAQAFWLGIVLKLKESGVKAALAGDIATFARNGIRGIAQRLSWDHDFEPFLGWFKTSAQWFVDIGDLRFVRIATSANPSRGGKLEEFPWSRIGAKETVEVAPVVIIRLDLTRLAQMLSG